MQFLLTPDEYEALKAKAALAIEVKDLQDLCTLAANHIPVYRPWLNKSENANPQPWGCVLDDKTNPGYCDNCPVTKICPLKGKRYSKRGKS